MHFERSVREITTVNEVHVSLESSAVILLKRTRAIRVKFLTMASASLTNSTLSLRQDHHPTTSPSDGDVTPPYVAVPCRNYLTFCVFASFLALGMAASINGPTFLHLAHMLHTDIETLGIAFTTGSVGYLLGSLICGLIADRFNTELQFCASTVAIGLMTSLCPWATTVYVYYAFDFLKAFGMGYIDAIGQSYIIYLWSGHRLKDPMMQAMHGIWSVGATLVPFMLVPLIPELPPDVTAPTTAEAYTNTSGEVTSLYVVENGTFASTEVPAADDEFKDAIRLSYALIGSCVLLMAVAFIVAFCALGPTCIKTRGVIKKSHALQTSEAGAHKQKTSFVATILFLNFALYFGFAWLEIIPGGYLATLALKGFKWDAKKASLLMAVFWFSHGASRILAVPISYVVRPGVMAGVCILGTTVGFFVMLISVYFNEALIWAGCAIAAFFLASIFASMILWTSNYIPITAFVGAVFLIGSSCGSMVGGPLVGFLFQRHSPLWIVYLSLIACGLEIVTFTALLLYVRGVPTLTHDSSSRAHDKSELKPMTNNEHA